MILGGALLGICGSLSLQSQTPPKPVVKVTASADRPTALYKVGEKVIFTVTAEDSISQNIAVQANLSEGTKPGVNTEKSFTLSPEKKSFTIEYTWEKPTFVLLKITSPLLGEKPILAGAGCEPEQLKPSLPKPDDFDTYWNAKKAEWDAMPFEEELTPVAEQTNEKIETYAITLSNIKGSKIRGFFAKPKGTGPFPVVMTVNYAGVYTLNPNLVASYASKGVMAIDVNPHDVENGRPEQYYKDLKAGSLLSWQHQGRDDRETSYFLRMFASCYRSGQYMAARPEWNKKQFVAQGSSMRGGQAMVTAYLCPYVTALSANVPALCDHAAPLGGRLAGWPGWILFQNGIGNEKQLQASRYYDVVNFANTIKAKALVSNGFIDTTCPPSSIHTAFNLLAGEKEIYNIPQAGHEVWPAWAPQRDQFIMPHSV